MKNTINYILIIALCLICKVKSWDTDELEIFDLVEEVNQNFYQLMGINQDATNQQLKRAFRNLSIILHPDKNPSEDANVQFRNLVAVYDVLKDPTKREKYDKVLKEGLPNWKSALYYYRRVRKMSIAEMLIILCLIITIGQYFTSWAVYLERKYTAEQIFGSRKKRRNKANVDIDAILNEIPSPSIFNTLPFQVPRGIWNLPKTIKSAFQTINEIKEIEMEKRRLEAEEAEKQRLREEEFVKQKEAKKELKETMRKRRQAQLAPEKTEEELAGYSSVLKVKELTDEDTVRPVKSSKVQLSGGFWTDEDLTELIRLVKKYPSGISNRWEIIGEAMNRTVAEVTFMAAKLKENGYRIPGHSDSSVAENIIQEAEIQKKIKEKTKKTNAILLPETTWSQEQQRALEAAIVKYKKSGNTDRWQKIANSVPGKTKEECLLRYKYLVELVKAQKENENKQQQQQQQQQSNDEENNDLEIVKNESKNVSDNDYDDKPSGIEEQHVDSDEEESKEILHNNNNIEEELSIQNKSTKQQGGKPRNKRKEKKKMQHFSDDEDEDY